MMIESIYQKCAGGCGTERELKGLDAEVWQFHASVNADLKWWCEPCGDRVVDEKALAPILFALTRQPHLRAKLREILEME